MRTGRSAASGVMLRGGNLAFEFRLILFIGLVAAALVFTIVGTAFGTYYLPKFVFGVIALVLDVAAMATRYYTYLLDPLIKMKKRRLVIESGEPYSMAPSGNAILKRTPDLVYATTFVKIPVYKSGTEMEDAEKVNFASMFGRTLAITKEPFRLSTQLYVLNKDEYAEKIRARLNTVQDRYNEMVAKEGLGQGTEKGQVSPAAERIRGELTMWRNMLETVNRSRAHSMISYAAVTAAGGTEEEATNLAVSKGDILAAGISSTFGVTAALATGDEILTFIEPEHMIPMANLSEQMSIKSGSLGA